MPPDFVDAVKNEIASLEAQLAADIRVVRIRELRKLMELYSDNTGTVPLDTPAPLKSSGGRKPSPEREYALDIAKQYLSGKIVPTTTREILAHLQAEGITYPGESPLNNLSAALSNAGDFVSNGRSGWTLKEVELRRLINDISEKIELSTGRSLVSSWESGRVIAPDIDGKLLAAARDRLGRDLGEQERAQLRKDFVDSLRQLYLVPVHGGSPT